MSPAIYVITYYDFNHGSHRPNHPIDSKFLETDKNYIFYLIDSDIPEALKNKKVVLEKRLDPNLHQAGGKHLGEWSFLLAEARHAFCEYPFFMISSRFYEKNRWLKTDLNQEWDRLFSYFNEFGWGYLPSYDRPLRWVDLSWERSVKNRAWEYTFFPFTTQTFQSIHDVFEVEIPRTYRYTADLFCNYIGFKSRKELLQYVNFYQSYIDFFFNKDFSLKRNLSEYVRATGNYRNEKPFTFLLELLCHLFFFRRDESYFALHYDGYYKIHEGRKEIKQLFPFQIPMQTRIKRFFSWQLCRIKSESNYCRYKKRLQQIPLLYKAIRRIDSVFRSIKK